MTSYMLKPMRLSAAAFQWAIPLDWPDRGQLAGTFDEIYLAGRVEVGYSAYNADELWELLALDLHSAIRAGIAAGRADIACGRDAVWSSAHRIVSTCRDPNSVDYRTEQLAIIPVRALPFVINSPNRSK